MNKRTDLKDRIKEYVDPLTFCEYEGQDIQKKSQKKWIVAGLCPFHADRNAGSFCINIQSGAFNCFSCGHSGGDIIEFTKKKYELTFTEAIQKLAADWRVS